MVERIEDMPAGTIGFRSEDALTDDDFRTVLAPALRDAAAGGEVRMMLVTPPGFGGGDVKTIADQVRRLGDLGHRSDWKRIAVLSDSGTLRRSSRVWTRLVPVETKVFKPSEEPQARRWLLDA